VDSPRKSAMIWVVRSLSVAFRRTGVSHRSRADCKIRCRDRRAALRQANNLPANRVAPSPRSRAKRRDAGVAVALFAIATGGRWPRPPPPDGGAVTGYVAAGRPGVGHRPRRRRTANVRRGFTAQDGARPNVGDGQHRANLTRRDATFGPIRPAMTDLAPPTHIAFRSRSPNRTSIFAAMSTTPIISGGCRRTCRITVKICARGGRGGLSLGRIAATSTTSAHLP